MQTPQCKPSISYAKREPVSRKRGIVTLATVLALTVVTLLVSFILWGWAGMQGVSIPLILVDLGILGIGFFGFE